MGTLAAYAAAFAWALIAGEELRDSAGPLLFAFLMGLLLVNLYTTGRRATSAGHHSSH